MPPGQRVAMGTEPSRLDLAQQQADLLQCLDVLGDQLGDESDIGMATIVPWIDRRGRQ